MKNNLYRNGRNGSSVGFFLTLFDNDLDCQIDEIGSRAQVFWIWQTKRCTPIYLNGQFTHEYYKLNGSNFQLMCEDSECTNCRLVCLFLGTLLGTLLGTILGICEAGQMPITTNKSDQKNWSRLFCSGISQNSMYLFS